MPGKFGYIKNYTYPAYQLENRTIYKYGINNKKNMQEHWNVSAAPLIQLLMKWETLQVKKGYAKM